MISVIGQSGSGAAGNVEEPFAGIKSGSEQKPISTETGAHSAVEPADVVNDAGSCFLALLANLRPPSPVAFHPIIS